MKSDAASLRHSLEMIGRIEAATNAGEAAFLASQLHQDAVLRGLHTSTETTQRLSVELKSSYPEVELAKLAAFRNVLVHDDLGIDVELVWTVVSRDIPQHNGRVLNR